MWIEAVAAALVGLSLLWLVFEPMLIPQVGAQPDVLALDGFEDLEDTRSGVALAALKEIEFDRETGKLSDGDYEFLRQKYTVEALEALRSEDAASPEAIEAEVAARVATIRAGARGEGECSACGASLGPDAKFCSSCGRARGAPAACAKCGIALEPGSRYCGACGGRVAA